MPKFRLLDDKGAVINATSVCVLTRQIMADKDGCLEMSTTEAAVLAKSYHVVGQDGSDLSDADKAKAQEQADAFAKRQAEAEAARKQAEQDEANARLEEAKRQAEERQNQEQAIPSETMLGKMNKATLLDQAKSEGVDVEAVAGSTNAQIIQAILTNRLTKLNTQE